MKKLIKWLDEHQTSQTEMAQRLGMHVSQFNKILRGSRRMPLTKAFRVEEITKGAITAKYLSSQTKARTGAAAQRVNG
jgi:DNA-binding transcriptional regulator YdaS (Cro superfamily)